MTGTHPVQLSDSYYLANLCHKVGYQAFEAMTDYELGHYLAYTDVTNMKEFISRYFSIETREKKRALAEMKRKQKENSKPKKGRRGLFRR